jgi:hypothetical protein
MAIWWEQVIAGKLTVVCGLGNQVVDLQFGMGEGAHHILLELYAQGNLLLTDADYNVLTLLRTHRCNFWELNYSGHALTFIPNCVLQMVSPIICD